MVKYLGSKRLLLPHILDAVASFGEVRTVLDLFSGTARVGHALKGAGYHVVANDHNAYAGTLARAYVQADARRWRSEATALVAELDALPGRAGWFTETYCVRSRFFQPHNGARVDAVRDAIAAMRLPAELEAIVLVALMEAADRVDSTTGVQMAYLKQWAPRSHRPLRLRLPMILEGAGEATEEDVFAVAGRPADLAYLDPPYNQHRYNANYHIWETLVRWDRPEVYGVACKRVDCRTRHSPFNGRRTALDAMRRLLASVQAPRLVVSFSDEGFLARPDLEALLAARGPVRVLAHDYKRYVGAQIGIFNPRGEKVGAVGRLRNTEFLYLVG